MYCNNAYMYDPRTCLLTGTVPGGYFLFVVTVPVNILFQICNVFVTFFYPHLYPQFLKVQPQGYACF